jgi:Mg2+ and Co2+ transporter CorA
MIKGRKLSKVYAKTNSDFFGNLESKEESQPDEARDPLSSGILLHNVLMYRNYAKGWSSINEIKPTEETSTGTGTTICCVITEKFASQKLLRENRVLKSMESVIVFDRNICWYHCASRSSFHSLLSKRKVPSTAMNVLMSSTPKCAIIPQSDGSIVATITTLFLARSSDIKLDQLYIFIIGDVVITYEAITSAFLDSADNTRAAMSAARRHVNRWGVLGASNSFFQKGSSSVNAKPSTGMSYGGRVGESGEEQSFSLQSGRSNDSALGGLFRDDSPGNEHLNEDSQSFCFGSRRSPSSEPSGRLFADLDCGELDSCKDVEHSQYGRQKSSEDQKSSDGVVQFGSGDDDSVVIERDGSAPVGEGPQWKDVDEDTEEEEDENLEAEQSDEVKDMLRTIQKEHVFFDDMFGRLREGAVRKSLLENGASNFITAATAVSLDMAIPVLNLYREKQRLLSEKMGEFSSDDKIQSGGDASVLQEMDTLRAGFGLLFNVIERLDKCVHSSSEKLNNIVPASHHRGLLQDCAHTLNSVTLLEKELFRMERKMLDLVKRRNSQISVALSMAAFLFWPLTFVASVFGTNFLNGGIVVYMMHSHNGVYVFFAILVLALIANLVVVYGKGWGDSLGEIHVAGRISTTITWWSRLFGTGDGLLLSKDEVAALIRKREQQTGPSSMVVSRRQRRYAKIHSGSSRG